METKDYARPTPASLLLVDTMIRPGPLKLAYLLIDFTDYRKNTQDSLPLD